MGDNFLTSENPASYKSFPSSFEIFRFQNNFQFEASFREIKDLISNLPSKKTSKLVPKESHRLPL